MADRSIVVRLRADISDYSRKMREAGKATKDAAGSASEWVTKNSNGLNTLSTHAGIAGAALVGFAGLAVKKFADFDAAMSNVAATGEDAKTNIDALRQAAIEAGAQTVFSASEAAGGIEELGKAGVSAADILGGGLAGALDLAAAGQIEVADAAEIAATAMSQFGLKGEDVTHIADLLAAGAGKAQGGVSDMSFALKQSGLVAAQFGLSIDETVGTLAAFAHGGLLGSDAGTSFRTMLLRLANPSKEASARMDELGISAYDAKGNFVGMASLAGQLKTALAPLPQVERDAALATIFGSDAIRAANVLYQEGAQGVADWTSAVDDQGYAAETAATRLNNLKGDVEQLGGSFETALIGMGEGANGPLRSLVQGATDVVNAFSTLPAAAQQATLGLVGGAGLVTLGAAGLAKLVTLGVEVSTTLKGLGVTAKTAGIAVGGIGAGIAAVTLGVTLWASAQAEAAQRTQELADTLDNQTGSITENTAAWVEDALTKEQSFGINNSKSMVEAAEEVGISVDTITRAYLGQPAAIEKAKAAAEAYLDTHADIGGAQQSLGSTVIENIDDQTKRLKEARDITESKRKVDEEAAESQGTLGAQYAGTTEQVGLQIQTLEDLVKAQSDAAGVVLSEREAQRGLQDAYANATAAIKENGATLDITTEAGRANQDALDDVASSGWDVIESMQANEASQEDLQAQMQTNRDTFLTFATRMGMSADEANRLADELGLIPKNITPKVTVTTSGIQKAQSDIDTFVTRNANRQAVVRVTLKTGETTVSTGKSNNTARARGALYAFADGGGIDGNGNPVARVPQIRPGGGNVLWAEPSTGWEAYISGKPDAHSRNVSILAQAAGRLGYAVTKLEAGGSYGYAAASAATPVTIGLPDGMRLSGQLDLGNGLTGFVDARVVAGLAADQRAAAGTRETKGASW